MRVLLAVIKCRLFGHVAHRVPGALYVICNRDRCNVFGRIA